ncbi:MAG: SulP family inorganic anion transporter [candidate division KSB1 bacterium]|nr:SulP family inorganic anion transporter [candidate division KSB1 bacterium]MDZ7274092.1 SulP family inorganic anion transporter [candidate division KSB1 bacterium]MDZ7287863.1 SulP family inorganic anion transporter [candidate division KSB1 bacterium]MDZ7296691.1 SulP family inorganic anion transporter [candidate division KSB1 bacterium]MDZ7306939.1 SulP family inorganic anion transporter [candidate division KSB1 bacterium]
MQNSPAQILPRLSLKKFIREGRGKNFNAGKLRPDLFAGLTMALFALPQSMAYALLAGLEPKHGLYAFIIGTIAGTLFGSSRHLQTGPTNASAIVLASALTAYTNHPDFFGVMLLVTLLAGLFQLGAGVLRLGNLTQFISRSVLVGFIAAAGLLIAVNQLPGLLGFAGHSSISIIEGLEHVFSHRDQVRWEALALGAGTVLIALLLNKVSPKSAMGAPLLPSYLLAILAAAAVVAILKLEEKGVRVVGTIPASLPPVSLPLLDLNLLPTLAHGALALMLIGVAEAVSAAKAVAAFSGDQIDADRELIGQGLAKISVAFCSGMPVSGSLTRSMLSFRSGAVTKLANISAGIFLAVIVLIFSPLVRYIPVAALAGMLVMIAVNMVNWQHAKIAIRATRADAAAMFATFAAALIYPLDIAIYIGVGVSLILFLRKVQTPRLSELIYDESEGFQELKDPQQRPIPEISIVHVEGDVFFGAAEILQEQIARIVRRPELVVLILRMKRACCLDATGILGLMQMHQELKKQGKLLLISGATGEVERVFRRSGLDRIIGRENIFFSDVTLLKSTREALVRALAHVNKKAGAEYRLRLFYDRTDDGAAMMSNRDEALQSAVS